MLLQYMRVCYKKSIVWLSDGKMWIWLQFKTDYSPIELQMHSHFHTYENFYMLHSMKVVTFMKSRNSCTVWLKQFFEQKKESLK